VDISKIMKMLKHRGKIIRHHSKIVRHGYLGGSINHLIHHVKHGGNISELKKQLSHLIIKSKPKKRIKF